MGKTAVAVRLAAELRTEIISADSRMVYRGMDIGTAKPGPAERAGVVHHLIDVADPDEPFNAGRFKRRADEIIGGLHHRGMTPIVVGGTGLYVKLLLHGLMPGPEADRTLRERLYESVRREGSDALHRRLREVDPISARSIAPRDLSKLVRAIEVFEKTGSTRSASHEAHRFSEEPYGAVVIGLRCPRTDLYRRIEERVDAMMERGLVEEVRGLLRKGYGPQLASMKALGYRQVIGFLNGEYDLPEAVRRIKRDTKRYAKRQFTWFNRDPAVRWVDLVSMGESQAVYEAVRAIVKQEMRNGKG